MRTRLLPLLIVLMAAVLLALGVPLAVSVAAAQQQKVVVDRIDDTARFAALAQFVTDPPDGTEGAFETSAGTLSSELDQLLRRLRHPGRRLLPQRHVPMANAPANWLLPKEGEVRDAFDEALLSRRSHDPQQVWPWQRRRLVVASPVIRDGDVVAVVVTDSPTGQMRSRTCTAGWSSARASSPRCCWPSVPRCG